MRNFLFFIFLTILSACSADNQGRKETNFDFGVVANGDAKVDVKAKLGDPGRTAKQNGVEAWQYCATGLFADSYITIWFRDERVIGNTKKHASISPAYCNLVYPAIDWEKQP